MALLLTVATGAWAQDPDPIDLTPSADGTVWTLSTMPEYDVELEVTYYTDAELDQMAADEVIAKITAIGTVTYTPESKALIDAARTAYDALTAAQQALVTNYSTLTDAETTYATAEETAYTEGVELTKNPDGTWTLAKMPACDVELEVEYKADLTLTVNIEGWTFGATANTPTVSGNEGSGAVTFEYKKKGAADDSYSTDVPTDAGEYTVRATVAETDDYVDGTATADFTIAKAAVTLTDGNDISALLPYAGKICDVSFVRSFTASRPSTVCLPFAYAPKSGEKFYTFVGITWNQIANEYYADMIEYTGTTLTANTPYLYLPSSTGNVDFGGTYTIPATIEAGTTTSGEWKFIGTYTGLTYGTGSFSGNVYGFAAEDNGTVERGQFIKGTTGATVPPMRCYLTYNNGEQFNAKTRAATELPSIIRVRLLDSNGNVTTGIGTLNTRTGEFSADDSWYTIGGQKLPEKPVKKGVYINNGTKVLIK